MPRNGQRSCTLRRASRTPMLTKKCMGDVCDDTAGTEREVCRKKRQCESRMLRGSLSLVHRKTSTAQSLRRTLRSHGAPVAFFSGKVAKGATQVHFWAPSGQMVDSLPSDGVCEHREERAPSLPASVPQRGALQMDPSGAHPLRRQRRPNHSGALVTTDPGRTSKALLAVLLAARWATLLSGDAQQQRGGDTNGHRAPLPHFFSCLM